MMATLSEDRKSITLSGRQWSETFTADQLAGRIRFYRSLITAGGKNGGDGPAAKFYRPTLAALTAVQSQLTAEQSK